MITTQTSKENIFSRIDKNKGGHLHRDKTKRGEGGAKDKTISNHKKKKKERRGGFT